MKDFTTYYEVLEVADSASYEEIHAAYRRMLKEYHPDRVPEHLKKLRLDAEEMLKQINEAWAVLGDTAKRQRYDAELREIREQESSPAGAFSVVLTEVGGNKINVIKALREVTSLGLQEAKDLVDGAPTTVKEGVSKDEAAAIKKRCEEAGAKVEVKASRAAPDASLSNISAARFSRVTLASLTQNDQVHWAPIFHDAVRNGTITSTDVRKIGEFEMPPGTGFALVMWIRGGDYPELQVHCSTSRPGTRGYRETGVFVIEKMKDGWDCRDSYAKSRSDSSSQDRRRLFWWALGGSGLLALIVLIGISLRSQRASGSGAVTGNVSPTFDCQKAKTPTEKQICGDPQLASLERTMVSSYNQTLAQLAADRKAAFRREHALWFKDYNRTCNSIATDEARKNCIASNLTSHTQQLAGAKAGPQTPTVSPLETGIVATCSEVNGWRNYTPKNEFRAGETMCVYAEALNVNRGGRIDVTFSVQLTGPNGTVLGPSVERSTLHGADPSCYRYWGHQPIPSETIPGTWVATVKMRNNLTGQTGQGTASFTVLPVGQ